MKQAGFTLVDVLIAVAIVVAGLGAIMSCYTGVIGNTFSNKLYNQKAYILQDVAERLKQIDNNADESNYGEECIKNCLDNAYTCKSYKEENNKEKIEMKLSAKLEDKSDNAKPREYNIDLTMERNEKLDKDKKLISCIIGVQAVSNDQHRLEMKTYYYLK